MKCITKDLMTFSYKLVYLFVCTSIPFFEQLNCIYFCLGVKFRNWNSKLPNPLLHQDYMILLQNHILVLRFLLSVRF